MKNIFEISIDGEKKDFCFGQETWDVLYEHTGLLPQELKGLLKTDVLEVLPDILQVSNELAGGTDTKDQLTDWLAKDPIPALTKLIEALKQMDKFKDIIVN